MFKKFLGNESGQSMILVALMLTVILGFGALAIDVGYMTIQKSSLQNAADSAALAGAMMVPKYYDESEEGQVYSYVENYAEENFKEDATSTISQSINRDDRTIEVTITQQVPKFLAGIFDVDGEIPNKIMRVKAKAKFIAHWEGEALPFVNVNDLYTEGEDTTITVWEDEKVGYFESIEKQDQVEDNYHPSIDPNDVYIKVLDYEDGIKLTPGVDNSIKSAIEALVYKANTNVVDVGKTLYVFSLKNQVITDEKYFGVSEDGKTVTSKNDTIAYEDLVLLKVELNNYYKNLNNEEEARLVFRVVEEYDISNGEFPVDYVSSHAKTSSTLIE